MASVNGLSREWNIVDQNHPFKHICNKIIIGLKLEEYLLLKIIHTINMIRITEIDKYQNG